MKVAYIFNTILSVLVLTPYNIHGDERGSQTLLPGMETIDDDPTSALFEALKNFQNPEDLVNAESADAIKDALTNKELLKGLIETTKKRDGTFWLSQLKKGYEIPDNASDDEIADILVERNTALLEKLPTIVPLMKNPQMMEKVSDILNNPEIQKLIRLNGEVLQGAIVIKDTLTRNKDNTNVTKEDLEALFDENLKAPLLELFGDEQQYLEMRDVHVGAILNSNFSEETILKVKQLYSDLAAKFISSVVDIGQESDNLYDSDEYSTSDEGSESDSEGDYDLVDLDTTGVAETKGGVMGSGATPVAVGGA